MTSVRQIRGFSLLELIVVICVLAIAAGILLDRLAYYQEVAEKADMEYVAQAVKSGLRVRIAELLVQGRAQELPSLAGENPLDWLQHKPANYRGLIQNAASQQPVPGNWYFDQGRKELVYLVRSGSHFFSDSTGQKRVRWQVKVQRVASDAAHAGLTDTTASVTLILVEPYRWL